ncbi:theg spermatid protein [Erpetoichthys calabaricus]|uniref:theg spermatid protein n=1 Tax=Erpetoichthys calabaricus TaxID=27687 RepID=UPI002234DB30|nr:theg spermatid protein [Erpetoichthys calabaricus]
MATTRIDLLAKPKKNFQENLPRASVYWLDEPPQQPDSNGCYVLSPRLARLSHSRELNRSFKSDRPSPIWVVSESALKAVASNRVIQLAEAKPPSREWLPDRSVYSEVSEQAKHSVPSARVRQLAQPKMRKDTEQQSTQTDGSSFISEATLKAVASPRVEVLANPKEEHHSFHHDRHVIWKVPEASQCLAVTEHTLKLATPKVRRALFEGYDPYHVSEAAKQATASARVTELSTPLPRKTRPKKV